ncbi:MAG TPA: hypothetical protein VMF50_10225 [Candidatus Binataceae bacterium]|nr:hypothetical protein [Candidatus Binataceae bacterium]
MGAIKSKLIELRDMIRLNPMKEAHIKPKVRKIAGTAKVIGHKVEAMKEIDSAKQRDETALERHLDRAIVAAELLDGILEDTLKAASAG